MKVLIIRYPLHHLTRNKSLSSIIGVTTLLAFVLLTFGYTHAGVYAVKILDNKTGIWFDSQQPLVPQIESEMLLQKKNMSETEFKRSMENLSDASTKMVESCSSPFSELVRSLCDFSVSTISVICKTEIAKHEIFECTNPAINQYLRKQEITDPEAYILYWIEKTHRGEATNLFTNTSNVILAEQQLQENQSMMQVTSSNSKLGNKTYPITYNVSGASVNDITAMEDYSTLVVYTDSNTDGTLTIQLIMSVGEYRTFKQQGLTIEANDLLVPVGRWRLSYLFGEDRIDQSQDPWVLNGCRYTKELGLEV